MFSRTILNIRQIKICSPLLTTYTTIYVTEKVPFIIPFAMITCLTTRLNHYYDVKGKGLPISNVVYTAIRISHRIAIKWFRITECSNILCAKKNSFATFEVSIDDFFMRYAGLGYNILWIQNDSFVGMLSFSHLVALVRCFI